MPRRAAFLYKIDTDETTGVLLDKIRFFTSAHKVNTSQERPWRGFLHNVGNGEIVMGLSRDVYYAAYGFERVKRVSRFDGETEVLYVPYSVSVIIDPVRRILALQTSDSKLAEEIFTLLQHEIEDSNYIRLAEVNFQDEFLRWLVNNAVRRGNGIFERMSGVKLGRLRDFDSELSDAILIGDDQIARSRIYREMRDNVHRYVIGYATIDNRQYKVRIYDRGQITLTVGEENRIAPVIPLVSEEIFRLHEMFLNSKGS